MSRFLWQIQRLQRVSTGRKYMRCAMVRSLSIDVVVISNFASPLRRLATYSNNRYRSLTSSFRERRVRTTISSCERCGVMPRSAINRTSCNIPPGCPPFMSSTRISIVGDRATAAPKQRRHQDHLAFLDCDLEVGLQFILLELPPSGFLVLGLPQVNDLSP